MTLSFQALFFLSSISKVLAAGLCPIYGAVFPPIKDLSRSSSFKTALDTLASTLDDAFATGNSSHGPIVSTDTYSIQAFSAFEERNLFEYYYEGSNLVEGTKIDGNSVYRLASTSKLYAVYMLLVEAGGDEIFSERVSKYLTELEGVTPWDEITVGALAGQVGGVAADLHNVDFIAGGGLGVLFPGIFPKLDGNETSPCIANVTHCTRSEFLSALQTRRMTYLANTTPAYSNTAFVLIGYILETISGKTFNEVLELSLKQPLGLSRTYATTPEDSTVGVLIHNTTFSGWNIDISEATAMGGMFASANDVSTLGRAILSSKLLAPSVTRAWMKPTSFTSSIIGFVGRPWEIYRSIIDAPNNRVVDIYTKSGNLGIYTSMLALIPDLGIGFTILVASEIGSHPLSASGILSDALIPAVQEAQRQSADAMFSGTYTAQGNANSSITLNTTKGKPGLGLVRWIANSADMFLLFGDPVDFRVYPSNAEGGMMRWKAVSGIELGYEDWGAFSACPTWFGVDRPTWGLFGLDDFAFGIEEGRAKSVEIGALKTVLRRIND
ncbi:beta-lactamase/transpeptidase-like protein [Lojkania enalia]|uniref:Beta-lactamase/transpeptidase-like protein n=1 Tax=Lojkania enalia TaxID=147567 RepID=A0A9P4N920_9PLEO|nr:beta-lactamase/transpeptidase-like protein [Didymosphaeria enalia]